MKKEWNLQLFAEDHAAGEQTDPNINKGSEEGLEKDPEKGQKGEQEKKYTDADVDKIVDKKYAAWKAKYEKDVQDAKAEAAKLAKMNTEQKQQYEMEKLQQENAELKAQAMKVELGREATTLLKESKIEATQDILDFVVGDDAEQTKANIDKFVSIIDAQLKAAAVNRATGSTPRRYGGGQPMSEVQKRIAKYRKG